MAMNYNLKILEDAKEFAPYELSSEISQASSCQTCQCSSSPCHNCSNCSNCGIAKIGSLHLYKKSK